MSEEQPRIAPLAEAEWNDVHQHRALAERAALSDAEIDRIATGPSAPEWSARDRALLLAADELLAHHGISDATYATLSEHWDDRQLMDLAFTVGQYAMVSMFLTTFRVQIERA